MLNKGSMSVYKQGLRGFTGFIKFYIFSITNEKGGFQTALLSID